MAQLKKKYWGDLIFVECLRRPELINELKKNPKSTFEKLVGYPAPAPIEILENRDQTFYIVLPQLDSSDLEGFEQNEVLSDPTSCFNHMIIRCIKDPSYKVIFMQDPKGMIAKECKLQIPENINIKVVEDSSKKIHLVIPAVNELSEEEIEVITGGANRDQEVPLPAEDRLNMPVMPPGYLTGVGFSVMAFFKAISR